MVAYDINGALVWPSTGIYHQGGIFYSSGQPFTLDEGFNMDSGGDFYLGGTAVPNTNPRYGVAVKFSVNAEPLTITFNPTSTPSGSSTTGTVTLSKAAGVGGVTLTLSGNGVATTGPSVTVLQGNTTATFAAAAHNAGYTPLTGTVTATIGNASAHGSFTANPSNYSSFVSQSIPATMTAGNSYSVSISFKNTGGTTWDAAHQYRLESLSPTNNTTFGINRLNLSNGPIAPGGTGIFTGTVVAPYPSGTYNFTWQCIQDNIGVRFGPASTNFPITVNLTANAAKFISQTVSTSIPAGTDFVPTIVFKNIGSATWTTAATYILKSRNPYNNVTWGTSAVALPGSIASGATATFTPTLSAPSTPGTYAFQWSMMQTSISQLFGDLPASVNIVVTLGPNDAQFVSTTGVPLSVGPGTTINGTITMKNLGTTTWDNTYSLVSRNPYLNTNWGTSSIAVTGTVAQNANAVFTHAFTAPATPGTYHFKWRMSHGGTPFGQETSDLAIVVSADAAHYVSKTGAVTVNAGQDFFVQYTMQNTGTSTWSTATNFNLRSITPTDNLTWGKNRGYFPTNGTYAPGTSVTITIQCTAPFTPGTYNMQWQMNHIATLFGETTPLIVMTVVQGADGATFVSNSGVPASVVHSTTFSATVTMKNTGTATWSAAAYSLVPIGSNNFGQASIAAGTVAPNANGTFTATFTAPATPGTYTFQWRMSHSGTKFGQPSTTVTVTVT